MANTTTTINLTGVTGNVYAAAGYTTTYTNVPQANAINFLVGLGASVNIINPGYATDTATGYHVLETIQVQGVSTSYTVWSYYGMVTLTGYGSNAGQVISFQLTTPSGGANNSGVNVQFLDGTLAFTSNISPTGVWTVWVTQGGTGTSTWGTGSVMLPYTAATAEGLNDFTTTTLNTAVNSSGVTNWGIVFTLTMGVDAPGVGAFTSGSPTGNATIYGTVASSATLTAGDNIQATGSSNTLNISDNVSTGAGGNVTSVAATVSGVQTLLVTSGEGVTVNAVNGTTSFTGLTQITATTNSQAYDATNNLSSIDTITAAATTSVTVTDTATQTAGTGNGGVTINGGNNISVTEKGATTVASTVNVGGTSATNPAGTVSVTISGAGNTKASVDGGTTASVTTSQTGAVTIGANTASTGAVTVTDTNGVKGGGTITVSGGPSATVTQTAAVTGSGQVGIANAVTVSGVTGANTVTQSGVSAGALRIYGGTTATIITTGNTAGITVGGTTAPTGTVTITDTNTNGASSDAISVDTNTSANTVGAVSITTTATSGAIAVGGNAANKGVSSNVTIVDQTVSPVTMGGKTTYGTGTLAVYTAGATSVAVTGGSDNNSGGTAGVVKDNGITQTLATVSLTGWQGTITLTGTALTTLNINNSTLLNPLNAAVLGSVVTVTNSTSGHTLAVGLSGDTASTTAVTDAAAKVFNVTATGTTANSINLTAGYVGAHTYNIVNNSTGTLTVAGITDTGGATSGVFTVGGTGAVNLGTVFSTLAATNYATLNASSNSGGVTATILGTQGFTGGSGANTITVTSAAAITTTINGGTGSNNTLIATSAATNYVTGFGGALTGFQNFEVQGTGITGSYAVGSVFKNLIVDQLAAGTSGNSATFTSVAAGTGLTVNSQTAASSSQFTIAASGINTYSLTINGVTNTETGADSQNIADRLRAQFDLNGVKVTDGGGTTTTITITGADSVAGSVTDGAGTGTFTNGFVLAGVVTDTLATPTGTGNTLPLTVNNANGAASTFAQIAETSNQTIAINSVLDKSVNAAGTAVDTNTINILDSSTSTNANGATTISITGAGNAAVIYNMSGVTGTAASAVATINASAATGNVDVSGVQGIATGLTITGGTGVLTAAGSGISTGAVYSGATDSITVGSGGGNITLGYAGFGSNTGTTQTINLTAATAKQDTVVVGVAGVHGVVIGYKQLASSITDVLDISKISSSTGTNLLNNVITATAVPYNRTGETYTVSNGVITFTGSDAGTALLVDAESIVNATSVTIAAYVAAGNTYVVRSSFLPTMPTDSVVTLNGITGTTGFGTTGSATTVTLATPLAGTAGTTSNTGGYATIDSATTALTQNDTGFFEQYLSGATAAAKVYNNLGASAVIDDASTGTSSSYTLTTTQLGTQGSDSLTLNLLSTAAQTITQANFAGDAMLNINNTATTGAQIITSLVDSGNTLNTINISGTAIIGTVLTGITDTALTAINDSSSSSALSLGSSSAALSQTGLTVKFTATTAAANQIYLSGAGDTINASAVTTGSGTEVLSATGAGSTILGGIGATGETLTVGATGTVTMLQGTAAAGSIAAINGDTNANLITVGANSAVTLGTTSAGLASDGGSTIVVTGDTAGSALTNMVTINNTLDSATYAASTKVTFFTTGTQNTGIWVNVASATSLTQAENIAVTVATNGGTAGNDYYAGFTYGGNSYVIGHAGAAETAFSANDIIVQLTGIHTGALAVSGALTPISV
jgi:hypothetical protein